MLNASLELNKALKELADLSKTLEKSEGVKACDLKGESRVHASIHFLKSYEVCVRIDEALRDIIRHKNTGEIETSLERAKVLLEELSGSIADLKDNERTMLSSYISAEFISHQDKLNSILSKRPAGRIWSEEEIPEVTGEMSHAIEALRKSAAYALLMCATNDEILDYVTETTHMY